MKYKKIAAVVLAGMMIIGSGMHVQAESVQEQITGARAEKAEAEAQLETTLGNISSLESKKRELENYLEELNTQYEELTGSVAELSLQAAEKESELKQINAELEEARASAKKQYEDMKLRIVYMYENGGTTMLELLLSSEGLVDFLNRAENIAQISRYDRDMLKKFEELQEQIREQEAASEKEAKEIDELLNEAAKKKLEVQEMAAGTRENIQAYIGQISSSQAEAAALNAQISSAENSISKLIVQAEAEKEAEREAQTKVQMPETIYDGDYDPDEDTYEEYSSATSSEIIAEAIVDYGDSEESSGQGTYLGNFTLTAYCNCASCCGTAGNLTASGTVPTAGRTVAMAGVPFGTKLLINGNVYTVEDLGTPYGHVDIYFGSHSEALAFGRQSAEVYQMS